VTGANVREESSAESAKLTALPKGTEVAAVIECELDTGGSRPFGAFEWVVVKLEDGRKGYIASRLLSTPGSVPSSDGIDTEDDGFIWVWVVYSIFVVPFIARAKKRGKARWAIFSLILVVPGLILPFLPAAGASTTSDARPAPQKPAERTRAAVPTPTPTATPTPRPPEPPPEPEPEFGTRTYAFQCEGCGARNSVSIRTKTATADRAGVTRGETTDVDSATSCEYCGTSHLL
jgi:hypothetical protein